MWTTTPWPGLSFTAQPGSGGQSVHVGGLVYKYDLTGAGFFGLMIINAMHAILSRAILLTNMATLGL